MEKRSDIPEKYKWDLTKIYKCEEDFYKDLQRVKTNTPILASYKGSLSNLDKLYEYVQISNKVGIMIGKLEQYCYLHRSENMEDAKYAELSDELTNILIDNDIKNSFFTSEIKSQTEEYFKKLLADDRFKNMRYWAKKFLRSRSHMLSESEAAIIANLNEVLGANEDIFDSAECVDMKFEDVTDSDGNILTLTHSNYVTFRQSDDAVLRKNAYYSLIEGEKRFFNTLSTNYITSVKTDNCLSRIYKYNSTLESKLFAKNISPDIYAKIIEKTNQNLQFYNRMSIVRKKFFGTKKEQPWDTMLPLSKFKKSYDFETSIEIIKCATECLGEEYAKLIDKAVTERWIDVYPNENKNTGGFCYAAYDSIPYILMNGENDIHSLFTLAHELGHALHHCYACAHQPYDTYHTTIFLAEIASTTNEVLLLKYLYSKAESVEEKCYYLDYYCNQFFGTLFTQMKFSEFEDFAHKLVEQELPISKKILSDKYFEICNKYSSHSRDTTYDENRNYKWAFIPHFYNSYYVYQYATGFVSAVNFATRMLASPEKRDEYLNMLSAGNSDYPTDLLNRAGIDLTQDTPYDIAFADFEWAMSELEKIIL